MYRFIVCGVAWTSCLTVAAARADVAGGSSDGRVEEELVVTARPLGDVVSGVIRPAEVLDRETLARRDLGSIGEAIARTPGMTSADFGPGVGRPVVRGLGGPRVRVLTDGLGSMDVSDISPDHAVAQQPLLARRVEVLRGPAALARGSGGEVVNVVTRRIPERVPAAPGGMLYAHHDSASDGWVGAFEADAGAGELALHLEGLKRDRDDVGIPGSAERVPSTGSRRGTLPNSGLETETFAGGASWVAPGHRLGVSVQDLDNRYGVPGGEGTRIEQRQRRLDLAAMLEAPLPGLVRLQARLAHNDHTHSEREADGGLGTRLSNDEWEGRVEAFHRSLRGWQGVVGLHYRHRDLSSSGEEAFVPPALLEGTGVFVVEQRDSGPWHVEGGMRLQHQRAAATAAGAARHWLWSVAAGLSRRFAAGYEAGIVVTRARRAPGIEELFAAGPHLATATFERGDADLDAETSTGAELRLARSPGRWCWRATVFGRRIDDFIFGAEQDLNGDGVADRVPADFSGDVAEVLPAGTRDGLLLLRRTQADAAFYGFEAEATVGLAAGRLGRAELQLWGDYVRGTLIDGPSLPRVPPLRIGAEVNGWREPWRASLSYTRVFRQGDTAPLEDATDGYHMLDLQVAWSRRWGGTAVRVFAAARNLLDEEARRHVSFLKNQAPLPGRSLLLGVRLQR